MIRTTRGTQQWVTYLNRLLLLALIFVATWTLPYFVPVAKTISVSYTTQYNNRAATLVFALGSLLYAWFTRGEMGQVDPKLRDWPLTTTSLGPALLGITLLFWAERLDTPLHGLLGESFYCLDRFQMLVQGRVPYRDFEFAYGPLQLYVPLSLYKVVHMRPLSAYAMWLWMQWVIGITMLWYVLRTLPLLLRWRPLIFWSLVVWYYPSMMDESMMYTPLRACYAAFAVTIVHRATVREGSKWQGVAIAFFATALGLGISPEQGVAVAAGLVLWFAILVFYKNAFVRLPALLAFVAGLAAIFGVAYREHMFKTLLDFSSGAFCYPICPSAHVAVVLSCYVAAACYATRFLRARDFIDISVPMLTAGLALLPAAFGRADLGHLAMASPILLLGIGAIQQQNITRRIWTIGAFIGFVGPAALAGMRIAPAVLITALHAKVWQQRGGLLQASNLSTVPWHFPCATVPPGTAPGTVAPFGSPVVSEPLLFRRDIACLDTGYYQGSQLSFNEKNILQRVDELRAHPQRPLLLLDEPLITQLPEIDSNPSGVKGLQKAFWLPPVRRAPLTFQVLIDYIQQHYTPDATPQDGYRIWRAKVAVSEPSVHSPT